MLIKYLWAWDVATHGDIHSIPFGRDLPVDGKQKYEFLKTVFLMACLLYIFSAIKALQSYRLVVGTIWGMIFDKYCRFLLSLTDSGIIKRCIYISTPIRDN